MKDQIYVDVPTQTLTHYRDEKVVQQYLVATAAKGVGEQFGSEQTPRGWHIIRAKIGEGCLPNTIFNARRPTGELFSKEFYQQFPDRDWILTRIIWLSGLERGKNRLGNCDTMRRYIYIHGVPSCKPMGTPGSKGCINMHNPDIIELFDSVPVGAKVFING